MNNDNNKKRVLIMSSDEGGGHLAATRALKKTLESTCDIVVFKPTKYIVGTEMYNTFMQSGNYTALKALVTMQPLMDTMVNASLFTKVVKETEAKIDKVKPHLVISVIPVLNFVTLRICEERNIPMLVIPTDLTFKHFFNKIDSPPANFRVAVPFEEMHDQEDLIYKKHFEDNHFVVSGYPLREEFGSPDEKLSEKYQEIQQEIGFNPGDKVVVIMMGAQGSTSTTLKYVRKIARSYRLWSRKRQLHVMVMCGQNFELVRTVSTIKTFWGVKLHALERKDALYVASLLRFADVFVSKPGGSSVNEALCSGIHTLYDPTSANAIYWEKYNMNYCIQKGAGEKIHGRSFVTQLKYVLDKRQRNNQMSHCPGRRFNINIANLVQKMIMDNKSNSYM
jgi:UDP-N-acetylglucosamine:LPS N-acetylglucosamine transferase